MSSIVLFFSVMERLQPQQGKSFMGAPAKLQNLNLFFDYLKGSKCDIYIYIYSFC